MSLEEEVGRLHGLYEMNENEPKYAVSVQTALWLARFAQERSFGSAADVGSGFTSWLLRRLVGRVESYDISALWAEKTSEYLYRMGMGDVEVRRWPAVEPGEFELVVYDSPAHPGKSDRMEHLPLAASMVSKGGFMVIDDFDWGWYRSDLGVFFKSEGWWLTSLEGKTLDGHGRYAGLAGPKP